ncbi:hypothetical protein [Actinomadura rudentiformis]|uniref:Secreted protein n=1 Tax=Actinomadura rudentiformis TaxID=359158 RepID=A0A6H9YUF3_9ACTN|nr:hypothetical protein [Actinomadura rudentiformis]KAB2349426.1 hypothetical protein F8566_11575 [Actinomadura rudentiformis]
MTSAGRTGQEPVITPADPDAVGLPAQATARTPAARRPRGWSTPARIRGLALVAMLLAVVSGLVAMAGTAELRHGFRETGHRSGRQLTAASELYSVLADLDAHAAEVLLAGGETAMSEQRRAALETYERRRVQTADKLYQAVAVAGDSPGASMLMRRLLHDFGRYQALVAEAMVLDGQRPHPAGEAPGTALARYREAADLMRHSILASAERLTEINAARVGRAHKDGQDTARWMTGAAVTVGVTLCGVLVFLQIQLSRRLRRRFNPGLAGATAAALVSLTVTVGMFTTAAGSLRTAEKDAFGSVLVLSRSHGVSHDANADESRGLLDPARREEYERAFLAKYRQLDGLLGAAWRNVTFPGERERAEAALSALREFRSGHWAMARPPATRPEEAVRLNASRAAGDPGDDFDRYIESLEELLLINQRHLDRSVADGERALDGRSLVPPAATALMVGLIYAGVRPRLAEYR